MSEPTTWSTRASFWRGDRALGGSITLDGGWLTFRPHAFDRATGGDTGFAVALQEISNIANVPPQLTFPRKRLQIETNDGRTGVFLVPRHDDVVGHLVKAVEVAGGSITGEELARGLPATAPDDSLAMTLIYSGWLHLLAMPFWAAALVSLVARSASPIGIGVVSVGLVISTFWTIRGFRRSSRIRAARGSAER